jgi:Ca2+-binding RTX toxin-like protein
MRWACGMLVLLVFGAGAAQATTVGFVPGGRFYGPRYLVQGGPVQNQIEIAYDGAADQFLISDASQPVETTATGCTPESLHTVRCENEERGNDLHVKAQDGRDRVDFLGGYGGPYTRVKLFGGGENDRLSGGPQVQRLSGGAGRDVVIGGGGGDFVGGGPGADLLVGGPGDDFLGDERNEDGADRMFGGPGDDDLEANQDGARDRKLDCGPGDRDSAEIERVDPDPVSCERVRVG